MVYRLLREHVNPVFVWTNNHHTAPFPQQAPTLRVLFGQGCIFIYKVQELFKLPYNWQGPCQQAPRVPDESLVPTTPVSPPASLLPSTASSSSQPPGFRGHLSVFLQHPEKSQDLASPVPPHSHHHQKAVFKARDTSVLLCHLLLCHPETKTSLDNQL